MKVHSEPSSRRADLIALAAIAVWVASSYWLFWSPGESADELIVEAPEREAQAYDLARDREIEVAGALGASRIEIAGRKARFLASPCPGQHCVHAGWLAAQDDVAACLPNGVTIYLAGRESRYDSINY